MRTIWILAVVGLLGLGCVGCDGKSDDKPTGGQGTGGPQAGGRAPGGNGGRSGKGSNVDPVIKEHEYPGSQLEGTAPVADTVSAIYKTGDDFQKVVAFYKQKFPGSSGNVMGTNASFAKQLPNGDSLTVTLTKSSDIVQVIVRLSKKR